MQFNKPYQHPAIISILSELIFTGPRAVSKKYGDRFLLDTAGRPEVPQAMLAAVCTGVSKRTQLLCPVETQSLGSDIIRFISPSRRRKQGSTRIWSLPQTSSERHTRHISHSWRPF